MGYFTKKFIEPVKKARTAFIVKLVELAYSMR